MAAVHVQQLAWMGGRPDEKPLAGDKAFSEGYGGSTVRGRSTTTEINRIKSRQAKTFSKTMAKKSGRTPRLKLVPPTPTDAASMPTGKRPARKLGPHGKALWDRIKGSYEITEAADIAALKLVCEAQDRLVSIEAQIKRDGLMVMGRNGPQSHPLLKVESSLRAYISRYLARLTTPVERRGPGRPSLGFGVTYRQLEDQPWLRGAGDDDDDDTEIEEEKP